MSNLVRSEKLATVGEDAATAIMKAPGMRLVTMHTDIRATFTGTSAAVILCDVSYSMVEDVQGRPKIEHLRTTLEEFPNIRKVSFSGRVFPNEVPEPNSSTRLDKALSYLREAEEFHSDSVILISDGLPDREAEALEEAAALGVPVHVVFIGDMETRQGRMGEEFMRRLAELTGGQQFTADSSDSMKLLSTSLTGAIKGLLGTGTGPIELGGAS